MSHAHDVRVLTRGCGGAVGEFSSNHHHRFAAHNDTRSTPHPRATRLDPQMAANSGAAKTSSVVPAAAEAAARVRAANDYHLRTERLIATLRRGFRQILPDATVCTQVPVPQHTLCTTLTL